MMSEYGLNMRTAALFIEMHWNKMPMVLHTPQSKPYFQPHYEPEPSIGPHPKYLMVYIPTTCICNTQSYSHALSGLLWKLGKLQSIKFVHYIRHANCDRLSMKTTLLQTSMPRSSPILSTLFSTSVPTEQFIRLINSPTSRKDSQETPRGSPVVTYTAVLSSSSS